MLMKLGIHAIGALLLMGHAPVARQVEGGRAAMSDDQFRFVATDAHGVRWSVMIADLQASTSLNAIDDVNTRRVLHLRGESAAHAAPILERTVAINCARREFSVVADSAAPPPAAEGNVRRAIGHTGTGNVDGDPVATKLMAMVCP